MTKTKKELLKDIKLLKAQVKAFEEQNRSGRPYEETLREELNK